MFHLTCETQLFDAIHFSQRTIHSHPIPSLSWSIITSPNSGTSSQQFNLISPKWVRLDEFEVDIQKYTLLNELNTKFWKHFHINNENTYNLFFLPSIQCSWTLQFARGLQPWLFKTYSQSLSLFKSLFLTKTTHIYTQIMHLIHSKSLSTQSSTTSIF